MKNPFDPLGIAAASTELWRTFLANPAELLDAQIEFGRSLSELATRGATHAVADGEQPEPLIEPAPGDRRFANEAWTKNPYFDAIKQAYLLASKTVLDTIEHAGGIDPVSRRRMRFFTKQFLDAMSPTNIPWLNPEVLEETVRTAGANIQHGLENIAEDAKANAGRPALVDESAFAVGKNVATTPGAVVFRNDVIELIQYAPTTAEVYARPLVIVPPWINKYYILDLQPGNSFIKYAVDQGRTVFAISWRNPDASMRDFTMADYLRLGPLTAARVACEITGAQQADVIGYCIGGTLTAMVLAYLQRINSPLISSATFFATLVDFSEPGEIGAFISNESLCYIEESMAKQGFFSGREMADAFNMLRANDLIWSVAVNRYLLGKHAPAFDLLYWNSDVTRIPEKLHAYYLRQMYFENNLVKPDKLEVDGIPLDLRRVTTPTYAVATADDHIAPWRSVYAMTQLFRGETTFRLGASGHIAGIISPPGKKKAVWWGAEPGAPAPPSADDWLAAAPKHEGSWWPDWADWLARRSPDKVPAPAHPGSSAYSPLAESPGAYVLER